MLQHIPRTIFKLFVVVVVVKTRLWEYVIGGRLHHFLIKSMAYSSQLNHTGQLDSGTDYQMAA
jgi:hypothetical protein